MNTIARHTPAPVSDLLDWLEAGFPMGWRAGPGGSHVRIEDFVEDDTYVMRAELPGVDPSRDVEIDVSEGSLTISGDRREEHRDKSRREFHYGAFSRTVALPRGANVDDVSATYKDGVLEVRVPISEPQQLTRKVEIHTEPAT